MRAIVQRVRSAQVSIEGEVVAAIEWGLCVLVGIHRNDELNNASQLAKKLAKLRIFNDAEGKMNFSLRDMTPAEPCILAVSNFTVYGIANGRRPSFSESASYQQAELLFDKFTDALTQEGLSVMKGVFGADMLVTTENDGPVTLIVEG